MRGEGVFFRKQECCCEWLYERVGVILFLLVWLYERVMYYWGRGGVRGVELCFCESGCAVRGYIKKHRPGNFRCRGDLSGGCLLSHLRSTIGVTGLNFSVRDGKRWIPGAITTLISRQSSLYKVTFNIIERNR